MSRDVLGFSNGKGEGTTTTITTTTTTMTTITPTTTTIDQTTPTSSVDTEEGHPSHTEEGERGVEGDAEASDDDHVAKRNNS